MSGGTVLYPQSACPAQVRLVTTELVGYVAESAERVSEPKDVGRLLLELIGQKDREHFVTVHLNARNRVISAELVSVGSLVASLVHPREVFKSAILQNAGAIICGHNHPSGDLEPSSEDHAIRKRLVDAGQVLGIKLLDFLIVGDGRWLAVSEREVST